MRPAHRGGLDRRQLVQLLCASVVAGCLPLSRCRPEAILPDPLQHAREAGRAALGADLELDGHHGALRAVVPGGLLPTVHVGSGLEVGIVVGFNVALAIVTWLMSKRYALSLMPE